MRKAAVRKLLFVVVACAVLVAVGVGAFIGGRATSPQQSGISKTSSPRTAASSSTTSTRVVPSIVRADVSLVTCPTTWGIEPGPTPKKLPRSVTLSLPSSLVGQVDDYTDQQEFMQLLGPKGWTCKAFYGADGGGGVDVYPPREQPPSGSSHVSLHQSTEALRGYETNCAGCLFDLACPLFPTVVAAYGNEFGKCPYAKPAEEQVDQISNVAVKFYDPPGIAGDGSFSGGRYAANGVMIYDKYAMPASEVETCTLSAGDHVLCAASLADFVRLYGQPAAIPSTTTTTPVTTTTIAPPFAFVDPSEVLADLSSAWYNCLGYGAVPASDQQQFLSQFEASEQKQAALAESGQPYFVPDPVADAYAFASGGAVCTPPSSP